jgi:hypothetical protein
MNRREAIKKAAALLGLSVSSPLIMHLFQGCDSAEAINWEPKVFNHDQIALVRSLADQILPKTDSPSASEVGVVEFIDKMVAELYTKKQRQKFLQNLEAVDAGSTKRNGKLFAELEQEEQYQLLFTLESSMKQLDYEQSSAEKPFFLKLKELVLLGYFTSETIMRNYLEYIPIPGKLEGCTPMEDNQKTRVGNYFVA